MKIILDTEGEQLPRMSILLSTIAKSLSSIGYDVVEVDYVKLFIKITKSRRITFFEQEMRREL
jgi:hypothetical protein